MTTSTSSSSSASTRKRLPTCRSIFSHDMKVQKIGQRYVMNMNYWDGGYVLLDVTDPRAGHGHAHRRERLRSARRGAPRARAFDLAGGQQPPVRAVAESEVPDRHGRGLQPVSRRRPRSTSGLLRRHRVHGDLRRAPCRRSTPTRRSVAHRRSSARPAIRCPRARVSRSSSGVSAASRSSSTTSWRPGTPPESSSRTSAPTAWGR